MPLPPLTFEPYLRPQIWGGRQLQDLNKNLPGDLDYGESWEISAHPLHDSRVDSGPCRGISLQKLVADHRDELLGSAFKGDRFPLLVKYLDCHRLLSVQVHPTDALAAEIIGNELGKTEAWVVLKTAPDARIYAGLKAGVTRTELESALDAGTVADCLHSFVPTIGDCIFIPAGTVHAMGGGILMAEIQQTSDATFRLFDWNRLGTDGQPRKLHVTESLQCIDWTAGPVAPVVPTTIPGLPEGVAGESLVDSEFFRLRRMHLSKPWSQSFGTWWIALVVSGAVEITSTNSPDRKTLTVGQTALIPASLGQCQWNPSPEATLLLATA